MGRSLRLLLALAQIPRWGPCAAARTTAFAAVFSLASEDPSAMHTLINLGFVTTAVDTALASGAPPRARGLAGGLMLLLVQAEQGLADAGGWTRVEDVLISLAGSGHPDLALQGCRGMAWEVYRQGAAAAKSLAAKGAVNVLLTVLYRAHHAFRLERTTASLEAHEVRRCRLTLSKSC